MTTNTWALTIKATKQRHKKTKTSTTTKSTAATATSTSTAGATKHKKVVFFIGIIFRIALVVGALIVKKSAAGSKQ